MQGFGDETACDILVSLRRAQASLAHKCEEVEAAWKAEYCNVSKRLLEMEHALRTGLASAEAERRLAVDQANVAFQKQTLTQQQDRHAIMNAIGQVNASLECVSRKVLQNEAMSSEYVDKAVVELRSAQEAARDEMERWTQDVLHQSSLLAAQQRALGAVERALHGQQLQLQEINSDVQVAKSQAVGHVSEAMARGIAEASDGWCQQFVNRFEDMSKQVAELAAMVSKTEHTLLMDTSTAASPPRAVPDSAPGSVSRPLVCPSPLTKTRQLTSPISMSPSVPTASPSPISNSRRRWRESAPPGSCEQVAAPEADADAGRYRWPAQRSAMVLPPPPRQDYAAEQTRPSAECANMPAGAPRSPSRSVRSMHSSGTGGSVTASAPSGPGLLSQTASAATQLIPPSPPLSPGSPSEATQPEVYHLGPPVPSARAHLSSSHFRGLGASIRAGASTAPVPKRLGSGNERSFATTPKPGGPDTLMPQAGEPLTSPRKARGQACPSMCMHGRAPPSVPCLACGSRSGSHSSAPPYYQQLGPLKPSLPAVPPLPLHALRRQLGPASAGAGSTIVPPGSTPETQSPMLQPADGPFQRSPYLTARRSVDSSRLRLDSHSQLPRPVQPYAAGSAQVGVHGLPRVMPLAFASPVQSSASASPRMRYASVPVPPRASRAVA